MAAFINDSHGSTGLTVSYNNYSYGTSITTDLCFERKPSPGTVYYSGHGVETPSYVCKRLRPLQDALDELRLRRLARDVEKACREMLIAAFESRTRFDVLCEAQRQEQRRLPLREDRPAPPRPPRGRVTAGASRYRVMFY